MGKRFKLRDLQLIALAKKSLSFAVGESKQILTINPRVLTHFEKHRQRDGGSAEAGGQLFAMLSSKEVVIEEVTGPRESDIRSRTLYVPDRKAEQPEIDFWHKRRLHYVGDWHTHPELRPRPSSEDRKSIRESFVRSKHSLRGFLMIVVGTAEFPLGLYVSLNNSESELVLIPCEARPLREHNSSDLGRHRRRDLP